MMPPGARHRDLCPCLTVLGRDSRWHWRIGAQGWVSNETEQFAHWLSVQPVFHPLGLLKRFAAFPVQACYYWQPAGSKGERAVSETAHCLWSNPVSKTCSRSCASSLGGVEWLFCQLFLYHTPKSSLVHSSIKLFNLILIWASCGSCQLVEHWECLTEVKGTSQGLSGFLCLWKFCATCQQKEEEAILGSSRS